MLTRERRARIRAALLAVLLPWVGFQALPWPLAVPESRLRDADVGAEIERWLPVVRALGLAADRREFEKRLVAVSGGAASFRKAVLAPLKPFNQATGTGQSFYVFTAPSHEPERLVIEVRPAGGAWRPVYRALDPELAWDRDVLRYRRVRAVIDDGGKSLDRFCDWLAPRAFAAFPDADEVRVRLERRRVTVPGEAESPPRRKPRVETRRRRDLAPATAGSP